MYSPQDYATALQGAPAGSMPHPDAIAGFLQMLGPLLQQQGAPAAAGQRLQTDQAFGRHLGMYGGAIDPATGMDSTSPWSTGMFSLDHGRAHAIAAERSIFGASPTAGEAHPIFPEGIGSVTGIDHLSPEYVGPNPQWLQVPWGTETRLPGAVGYGDNAYGRMRGGLSKYQTQPRIPGTPVLSDETGPRYLAPRLRF